MVDSVDSRQLTANDDLSQQFDEIGYKQQKLLIDTLEMQTRWQIEYNVVKAVSDMTIAPTKVMTSMAGDLSDSIR